MDLESILSNISEEMDRNPDRGKVASYIPELAAVDASHFGMAVAMADGRTFSTGEADLPFSIQSISKVFTLAIALGRLGDELWKRTLETNSGNELLNEQHFR